MELFAGDCGARNGVAMPSDSCQPVYERYRELRITR